ncbi:carbohydrate ABC transporter permease [Actinotalea sp. M2MS4P-6]|uniref:carbohydrate ABC transporter permease n=1 Tax=Actinotalea sp. M2MS4P-6 TaxID=2983762 RepID=UPI0021E4CD1E|nr:carbohydrate ABC transporter permease [Actinotalea sp. M2MS4P-6]MCV2395135.1 carbohydrate ABC transporter permease [Actinotalea sp. M2MS4P-6]
MSGRRPAQLSRRVNLLHLILVPVTVAWMLPIVIVIGLSLKPTNDPGTIAFGMLPRSPSFANYVTVFQQNPIPRYLFNSALIAVPSVVLVVLLGSMAAFALARLRVPAKGWIFGLLTLALVLPMSSIVVATFQVLQALGLYNSTFGVSIVYTALGLPFAIILIRTSFMAVPQETHDAAVVDGANKWQTFWHVYLPLARPAIAVVVVWQLMLAWNDFLLPLVSLVDKDIKPLTLIPLVYRGEHFTQVGALFAILIVVSVPIVATFAIAQRSLVNGLAGAVK